jgi:hypothetical protein
LRAIGSAALLSVLPKRLLASVKFRRSRPSDSAWPTKAAWKQLHDAVDGNLIRVDFPLASLKRNAADPAAQQLLADLNNPYFIGDQPGLTQTLGWVDAWATQPSAFAVTARSAEHIATAVRFARDNNVRLVVKGGGHSYQGTSNAPDSLLIWTRHMHEITVHDGFVPEGCEHVARPLPAVSLGAGTIWMQAYAEVTTKHGKYVQGGGCTTVGVAGLVQSGGFGSHSKHYGTAAGNLLEAEVVTADGTIRVANACTNSDLFWALKGGGGGTFGVVSKLTLRLHELPEFFGGANFTIKASSADDYRRLVRRFVGFYRERLFNDHWGEQVHINPDNTLEIRMTFHGLDSARANAVWQPFLDWVRSSPQSYAIPDRVVIGSIPARRAWDVDWWKEHWPEIAFPIDGNPLIGLFDYGLSRLIPQPVLDFDNRPGASQENGWWKGDAGQVAWFIWGYESLWLPESLLEAGAQETLAEALFASSRYASVGLHFNKGLAGAPPQALASARDTAMNPAVLTSFALAIVADGQGPAYPGVSGHEPSLKEGRMARTRIARCMSRLRAIVPNPGAYVSESNYFEQGWQNSYWGSNYPRLSEIKRKYDPNGLFVVHNGVGSEQWSADGFTEL